jgi:hypothetical protein
MRELVSGLIGALLAALLVFGGVMTYQNVSTESTTTADPQNIGYADE